MDEALTGDQAGEIIDTARRQKAEKKAATVAERGSDGAGLDRGDVDEVNVQRER